MKFWHKTYSELTVKELTIWALVLYGIGAAISYIYMATDWFETAGKKITGIWNKIFRK